MFQDREGYLWSGGFGGLTRFDGQSFVNYNPKNGLIDHNVTAIEQDDYGNIFVGTNKGLSVVSNNKIFNYKQSQGLTNLTITSLCKGFNHNVYIGTFKGLYTFRKNKINNVPELKDYKINSIYKADTSLYIGTNNGLIIYGQGKLQIIDKTKGLPSNQINCIVQKSGLIVIGTDKGLSFYNRQTKKITSYFIENGLIDENISTLLNQNDDYLWIGSHTGLLRFDGDQFSYYNIGYDNNSNIIRSLIKDREDNLWVGTHSGLYKYRDNSFSTFDKINGPGNAFIFHIFRDNKGDLWMCSENNGIYKYSQGYFKHYGIQEGLGTNVCKTGLQDKEGRLLFGTKNGLMQLKNERFINIPLPKEFKGTYEMLFKSKDNTVWIAGGNGIAALTWKGNTPELTYKSLPFNTVYQTYGLCQDDEGNLWIGTSPAGLFMLRGDSIRHISKEFNMAEEDFFAVKCYKNYVFAATLNGLLILNTTTRNVSYITQQDGLNSEFVYSIELAENYNVLCIGTNQGINKLNLKKYIEAGITEITSFGKFQGFMGVECNSNGIWEDHDGSLWFGTISGLVKHEPYSFKKNRLPNSTLIQNIKLFSEDTLLKNGSELPSRFNTITFYYKGICLTGPEKVLYIKKLEGLEKEWSLPSAEDYSKYANLAPGKYTFKVKSRNNEGIWDAQETSFSFTILTPFFKKWWFILGTILLSLSLISGIIIYRIKSIKKKQRLDYDRKVEMSKIELKALRSQMNPHFIFNSLNSIQHYIFNSKTDEAIKYLSKFARLVRIILNNSNKPTVTVGEDLEALKLYLQLEQMRFEDKFEYEITIEPSVDADYDIMPPLLTQPYVENAILHGLNPKPEKGKLCIHFKAKDNFLVCTITDNGIGRQKAGEIKRTMPVSKHKSLGMQITEDRLKILNDMNNSKLSVTITDLKDAANNPAGTQVELYIPING